jgi:hypothetical protein
MVGALLIFIMMVLSGSTTASWVDDIDSWQDVTNRFAILDAEDSDWASLGNFSTSRLGWIIIDCSTDLITPTQTVTVYCNSETSETFRIRFLGTSYGNPTDWQYDSDTGEPDFVVPSSPSIDYYYIEIQAVTGVPNAADPAYGPDIDAIYWP